MGRYPEVRSASIPALWAVQRHYGWCTPEGIRQAAAVMGLTPAYLESVASFYDLFRIEPVGRHHVLVCHNISCWMRGADDLLSAFCEAAGVDPHEAGHGGASSPDGEVFVSGFECLGACDIAPMASIDERYYGPLDPTTRGPWSSSFAPAPRPCRTRRWPNAARPAGPSPSRTRASRRPRPMAAETRVLFRDIDEPGLATIDGYRRLGGYRSLERAVKELEPDELLPTLEESGLRGRGGAGFSMGKKGSFLPRGEMDKYLCCNADESEPGTFKDRELMLKNPHQLIEGVAIAALAVDASRAFIFIRGEYAEVADILEAAVAEAYDAGFLGRTSSARSDRVELVVHRGAGRLHLRRGDRAARLARGQARQPAAEAPVPGDPGPLRRADADQQRRDADERPAHRRQRRRLVQELRHRAVDRDEGRLGLGLRPAARQLRDRARHPLAGDHLRARRRPARGPRRSRPGSRAAPRRPS